MPELDNRAHLNLVFATKVLHASLFMRCAFPISVVIAGQMDFIWMTATISEPDQLINYHFFKPMACAFFEVKGTNS